MESKPKWTCRDGTKIPVKNMTTRHIKNTMAMMRRMETKAINSGWGLLSMTRGEQASYAIEQDLLSAEEDGIPEFQEWLGIFTTELLDRGEDINAD